jgi:drug/metabolite transporter (DMT)-like permease
LLRRFTATFVSFAGFTTPLFTAILGWFFLGETVTMSFYLSTIVVFSGLYLFYQDELQKGVVAGKASPEEIPSAN